MATGRLPGGKRVWKEWQHPRDDRGRFAKKGGARWAARVVGGMEARFGDTSMAQGRDPRTIGRAPGGLIDLGALAKRGREAGERRKLLEEIEEHAGTSMSLRQVQLGDQVNVGGEWREVWGTGFRSGVNEILWRDTQGVQRGTITENEQATIRVRQAPKFEAGKALKPGGEQERRMNGWRDDAQKPPPFRSLTQREGEILRRENEVAAAEVALKEATRKAKARARRKYPEKEGYGKYTRDEYVDRETWTEQHTLGMAKSGLEYLRAAELSKYDNDIDVLTPPVLAEDVDRSRPLSVYGNMLHAKAYDEASFRALAELESIPIELHQIVAAAMVRKEENDVRYGRHKRREGESSGIYVGNGGVAELLPEYFKETANNKPRGWHEGATYHDIAGVFSPTIFAFAVGHTPNREGAEHTAAEHEFGHALDFAIGSGGRKYGYDNRASHTEEWEGLHDRVLANHGPGLSPYFQQPGGAGRQEFWAEAFAVWVRAYRNALASERQNRLDGIKSINPDVYYAGRASSALKREFDITENSTVDDLHSYFLKLSAGAGVRWE